jgi:surface protein
MMRDCSSLNDSAISNWNVSDVTNMSGMFLNCTNFNVDLSLWNTIFATNMGNMFYNCTSFASDLSAWTTGFVTNMSNMFVNADSYSSNMGIWDLQSLDANNRLDGFMVNASGMTTSDYDATLSGWDSNKLLYRNDLRPNFGGSKYTCGSAASDARAALVAYGWTITDGGCSNPTSSSSSSSTGGGGGETPGGSSSSAAFSSSSSSAAFSSSSSSAAFSSSSSFSYNASNLTLVYDTSKEPANNTVSVPLSGAVNVTINWGDGTSDSYITSGFKTHTYSNPGVYVVQVSGSMTALDHGTGTNTSNNKSKLIACLSFGNISLTNMDRAFRSCSNLLQVPSALPVGVTNCLEMFRDCSLFNDSSIASWNVSNVDDMSGMFLNCTSLNVNLAAWNTSSVTNTGLMFYNCPFFSSNLASWNMSAVTTMTLMFYNADSYSSNMASWGLQSLNVNSALDNFMLFATGLSVSNYDSTLIGWNTNKNLYRNDLRPNFGGSTYTCDGAAATARAALVAYGWTITDGGCVAASSSSSSVVTVGSSSSSIDGGGGGSSSSSSSSVVSGVSSSTIGGGGGGSGSGSSSSSFAYNPNNLTLVYDTSKEPSDNIISLPLAESANVTVDWGDGLTNTYNTAGFKTHTYENSGVYVVQVSGSMTGLDYGTGASSTDNKLKLVRCLSFGNVGINSLQRAFRGCSNFIQAPSSLPVGVFGGVANCSETFRDCPLFVGSEVGSWDTSTITDTNGMFANCSGFNADLSSWSVALVTDMRNMFYNCPLFNSDLKFWSVDSVEVMSNMFFNADAYTTNMYAWNLQGLNANNSIDNFMTSATGLSNSDYDATLIGWETNKSLFRSDLRPNLGGSKYTPGGAAAAARAALVAHGWTITDGGTA